MSDAETAFLVGYSAWVVFLWATPRGRRWIVEGWHTVNRTFKRIAGVRLESAPKEVEPVRGHRTQYAFKDGTKSCTRGRPRVLEVRSVLPPHEVVGWLCLDCGESVNPYTDGARAILVSEDQVAAEINGAETYVDNFTGKTIHTQTGRQIDPRFQAARTE